MATNKTNKPKNPDNPNKTNGATVNKDGSLTIRDKDGDFEWTIEKPGYDSPAKIINVVEHLLGKPYVSRKTIADVIRATTGELGIHYHYPF